MVEYVREADVRCDCMDRGMDPDTGIDPRGCRPCLGSCCNKNSPGYRWGCQECNFTKWVSPCGRCQGHGVYDLMGQTRCLGDDRGYHDNSRVLL